MTFDEQFGIFFRSAYYRPQFKILNVTLFTMHIQEELTLENVREEITSLCFSASEAEHQLADYDWHLYILRSNTKL